MEFDEDHMKSVTLVGQGNSNSDSNESKQNSRSQLESTTKTRCAKTTRPQYEKMISHFGGTSNNKKGAQWDRLVLELNAIGPPSHTIAEWKKVWTDFKGNQKRKRRALQKITAPSESFPTPHSHEILHTDDNIVVKSEYDEWTITDQITDTTDTSSHFILPSDTHEESEITPTDRMDHFQAELLRKFDMVIEQQTNLNVKSDLVIEQHQRLNDNLEKFMKLIEAKFVN